MKDTVYVFEGDVLSCLVNEFSKERHHCVVLKVLRDSNNKITDLLVLPITSSVLDEDKEVCLCFDCNPGCNKLLLTANDTEKVFRLRSFLMLTSYAVSYKECNCNQSIQNYRPRITKRLRNKLIEFNIYV